ncbi:unnamed protein product [Oppiella nova]|uniref:Endonuclease III homolog n=1 Tax=Oppiella nova TaxID=334625 RepID=A0A7R9LCM0_9ACAR|nr:unnamed protein product [Oppiella nova]CAG2162185.1 unnamed protein product [Oppiella nova]
MSTRVSTRSQSRSKSATTLATTSAYFATKASNESKTPPIVTSKPKRRQPQKKLKSESQELDTKSSDESSEESEAKASKKLSKESSKKSSNPVFEPKNWKEILENIRKMRDKRDAVVDSMGAEKTFDESEGNPKDKRFQVLVSLMLSSQTRDEMTYKTMQSLREYGLTVSHIIDTSEEDLSEMIRSVSFYRNKTKFIKQTALILRDQFDGDIPSTVEGLLSLPGVGPKMTHLAMKIAWDQLTGIAVDTHVHRICNRLKWTDTKSPEQTEKQLEQWLPKDHWEDFNLLVVGFGQTICSAVKPKCGQCLNQKLCPFFKSQKQGTCLSYSACRVRSVLEREQTLTARAVTYTKRSGTISEEMLELIANSMIDEKTHLVTSDRLRPRFWSQPMVLSVQLRDYWGNTESGGSRVRFPCLGISLRDPSHTNCLGVWRSLHSERQSACRVLYCSLCPQTAVQLRVLYSIAHFYDRSISQTNTGGGEPMPYQYFTL